jgi:hypothetical protein
MAPPQAAGSGIGSSQPIVAGILRIATASRIS